jgi:hypothetical protein
LLIKHNNKFINPNNFEQNGYRWKAEHVTIRPWLVYLMPFFFEMLNLLIIEGPESDMPTLRVTKLALTTT